MLGSHLSSAAIQALLQAQVNKELEADKTGRKIEPPGLVIAITREAGAMGSATAVETGSRLGWPVYDRLLLEKIAEEAKSTPFDLEMMDERSVGWLQEVTTSLVRSSHVSSFGYLKHLVGVVRGLAAQGRCIIVGRGAGYLVPIEQVLRVRLVADLADRVRNIAQQRNINEKEARAWVTRTDAERTQFVKTNFGIDPVDPHHYDLVLNTSRAPVADCAELIIEALRRAERRAGVPAAARSEPARA